MGTTRAAKTAKKLAAVLMLVSFIFSTVSPAMATAKLDNDPGDMESTGIRIYDENSGMGGEEPHATGYYAIAMGLKATASGDYSTSMGYGSIASGRVSVAISNSVAAGSGSFAGGGDYDPATGFGTAGGTAYGRSSFAFGVGAVAGVDGDTTDGGQIAMGNNAQATHANSVALGNNSVTVADNTIAVGGTGYSTWKRITGVADGTAATDAATFGQLTNYTAVKVTGKDTSSSTDNLRTASGIELAAGDNIGFALDGNKLTISSTGGSGGDSIWEYDMTTGASGTGICVKNASNTADGNYSTSMGYATQSSGNYSTSMGYVTQSRGNYSTSMGSYTIASGDYSTAMGAGTIASGERTTAMGTGTRAIGNYSTAMGWSTSASGDYSTAMGDGTSASGDGSTAMGAGTTASGNASTAMGDSTTPSGRNYTTAMGYLTTATGSASTAMGWDTNASGDNSTSMGYFTNASGFASTAMGYRTNASGDVSTAMGWDTTASGWASTAMGWSTNASGTASTAMGDGTNASGTASTAMGDGTNASGFASTAMGYLTTASGGDSVSMGYASNAVGYGSFAGGGYSHSTSDYAAGGTAYGKSSFAFGIGAVAGVENQASTYAGTIALGNNAQAVHKNSVALGNNAVTRAVGDPITSATIGTTTYNFTGGSTAEGVVSIGGTGHLKQLINVANGAVACGSTDAVNGGQLYDIISQLPAGGGDWTAKVRTTDLAVNSSNPLEFVAGDGIELSADSTSGNKITIKATGGGTDEFVVRYDKDAVSGEKLNSVTLKDKDGGTTSQVALKNVAGGVADTDAVNVAQLKEVKNDVANLGSEVTTLGETVNTGWNAKVGDTTINVSPASKDLTFKGANENVVIKADAATNTITIDAKGSTDVAAAHYDTGTEQKVMTLAGEGGTTIKNVAAGVENTDAVNVGQLNSLAAATNQAIGDLAASTNNALGSMQNEINSVSGEVREVGAISAALAGLHYAEPSGEEGDRFAGAVAYGGYRGESAAAVGVAFKPNPNFMLSASTSVGNSQNAYNAGISYKFGKGNTAVTRAALQKQVKYVNEQNTALKAENAAQNTHIAKLENDKALQDEVIRKLLERVEKLENNKAKSAPVSEQKQPVKAEQPKVGQTKTVQPKPETKAAKANVSQTPVSGKNIQVFSSARRSDSQRLADSLNAKGYNAFVGDGVVKGRTYYRTFVDGGDNPQAVLGQLKAAGINGFIFK
ncbi:MAG: YadA-like family protein [Synergistaceae bacterium]|nr:YadA-like family protein [Candidatus Equadaptatus faecalis]